MLGTENRVLEVVVCVKDQLVTSRLKMTHLDLHSSRRERVSAVARTVTGLASVKVVVKLLQVIVCLLPPGQMLWI